MLKANEFVYLPHPNTFKMRLFSIIMSIIFSTHLLFSSADGYTFEKITNSMGLSQGRIHTIIEDKTGFMWFGTKDGLNWYNGYEIKTFKKIPSDTNSISNNDISKIILDYKGNLWIATAQGLNRFNSDDETFTKIYFSKNTINDIANNTIIDVCSHKDKLYATTFSGGFYMIDPITEKVRCLKKPKQLTYKEFVNYFSPIGATNDKIWFFISKELFYYDLKEDEVQKINCDGIDEIAYEMEFSKIIPTTNKRLLISTFGRSIVIYDPKTNEISNFFPTIPVINHDHFLAIYDFVINDSIMYVGTHYEGLYIINMNSGLITNLRHDPEVNYSISSNNIRTIYVDKNNLIWIGTNGRGINILSPTSLKFKGLKYDLLDPKTNNTLSVRAFLIDGEDNLWVGGYNALYKIDRKKDQVTRYMDELPVYSLLMDPIHKDTMWVGLEGPALAKFNIKTGDYIVFHPLLKKHKIVGDVVYSFLADSNIIWAGTQLGLNRYNILTDENEFISHDPYDSTSINLGGVVDIMKDINGDIWIGTNKGGVGVFNDKDLKFKHFLADTKKPRSLSGNSIKDIFQDSKGDIWIATTEGLNRYKYESNDFDVYNRENLFSADVIYGIQEDNNRNLWISTNHGICRFNPETLEKKCFSKKDGLQDNEFNTGAHYMSDEGEMFFGGVNGFNYFFPEDIVDNPLKPDIVFTKLKKLNEEIKLNPGIQNLESLTFDHDDAIFTIEFSALNFTKPSKNQYAYKLEGVEGASDEWINIGNRNFFDFTGLKPGEYVFRVKASNNDGVWNENDTSIRIIIKPPFWNTFAFRVFAIIGTIIMIYLIFILRVRSINHQKKKLSRLVDEKTQELQNTNSNLRNEIEFRKKAEKELAIANKTKDKFFSIIGHDLKSPLNSLLGFTDLLHKEYNAFDDAQKKEFIEDIYKNTSNLSKLTDNLLFWARTQTGKIVADPANLNIDEIVYENVELLKQQAFSKEISIDVNILEGMQVYIDKNMANTVFRNIISNAIKFTNRGGKIKIDGEELTEYIDIRITDNGVGMNQEAVQSLFNITKKFKTYGTEDETGTGLGLIVCKEFMLKSNGDILVESEPGKGSKFIVRMPTSH